MKKFLSLLVVLLTTVINAEALSTTVTVTVDGGTGGKVYVSTTSVSIESISDWQDSYVNYVFNNTSTSTKFYLYAKADPGYVFKGWTSQFGTSTSNPFNDIPRMDINNTPFTATFSKIACTNTSTSATYTDIQTAVNEASAGNTIQLATDVEISSAIKVESAKNFTLDLKGHILKGTMDAPTAAGTFANLLYINNSGAVVNIIDTDPTAEHTESGMTGVKGGVLTGGKGYQMVDNTYGGAIYLNYGTLNIGTDEYKGGTIIDNDAIRGAGIANMNGTLKIKNCVIKNNGTLNENSFGGGVYADGSTELTKCTLDGNKASVGGGLFNGYSSGTNTITECTISNNTANEGGGIDNMEILDVKNCTISGNIATMHSGGIYNYCNITLEGNTSVTGNLIDPNSTEYLPFAGVLNGAADATPIMTLKGKVTIENNTAKGSKSNLCVLYYIEEGTKVGPVTLTDFDISSKIGVTTFYLDNDDNPVYGPYQFTTNGTEAESECFSSDNANYYRSYNSTDSYSELKEVPALEESTVTKAVITPLMNQNVNVSVKRTFYKDGGNNTICLPFSLDADALAASPLTGYTKLQEFTNATVDMKGKEEFLAVYMKDATEIVAGKPYIISWASGDNIVNPVFKGVTISADAGSDVTVNNITFHGTLIPQEVTANDQNTLFVGTGGELHYPSAAGKINAFRGYFSYEPFMAKAGIAAFLIDSDGITGINNADADNNVDGNNTRVKKLIEQGKIIIISNGVSYDLSGKIIK